MADQNTPNTQPAAPAEKTQRSVLTFKQRLGVAQWISCNQERLMKERPSYGEAASQCGGKLGFAITAANMESIALDMETGWKPACVKKSGAKALWDKIKSQGERIAVLEEQLAVFRGTLITICRELDVKPTPGFDMTPTKVA